MKPILQFLSDEEVKLLHDQALQILSSIGMHLPHDEALELMSQNGAEIVNGNVVRIPNKMIDAAIESVPKRKDVTLFGRAPQHDVTFEKHQPSLACMTMAVNVIDPYTRKKRPATNDDLAALTRSGDTPGSPGRIQRLVHMGHHHQKHDQTYYRWDAWRPLCSGCC